MHLQARTRMGFLHDGHGKGIVKAYTHTMYNQTIRCEDLLLSIDITCKTTIKRLHYLYSSKLPTISRLKVTKPNCIAYIHSGSDENFVYFF